MAKQDVSPNAGKRTKPHGNCHEPQSLTRAFRPVFTVDNSTSGSDSHNRFEVNGMKKRRQCEPMIDWGSINPSYIHHTIHVLSEDKSCPLVIWKGNFHGTFRALLQSRFQRIYKQLITNKLPKPSKTFDCHAVWLSFCARIESLCKKNRQAKCRQPDGRTDGQYLYVERRVWWLIGINRTISLISTTHRLRIGDELSCLRKQTHAQNKQNVQEKQRTSVYLCHQIHLFLPPKQHVPSPRYG